MVDATVPLAAAVSGRATRMLGVWQGSAAQQAAEMVPDGVRVVSALHTVSAATLADLDTPLDEDVLVCGDRRADKRAAAALIARVPGLRPVDCGRLEQARIAESLTALLIGVNARYKTHAGVRLTGLPDELWPERSSSSPAAPAARSSRAGCSTWSATSWWSSPTPATTSRSTARYVSPDPDLVTFWLADRIDERGWGLRGDTFAVMDDAARARRGRLVQPRRPRPRRRACSAPAGSPRARR